MAKLKCFDLFAGCGGLSLGLGQAGIDVMWANEIDGPAAASYRLSHPNCRVFEEDVVQLHKRLLDGDVVLPKAGEVDLVAGGPPCQGFSGYNRHRHINDPRNSLVESFLDVVECLRPRYVLMENVPGMLSLSSGKVPELLLAALDSLGYEAKLGILQAGYYGLPQNRWRVFVIACLRGLKLPEFPKPMYSFPRTTIFGATAFKENVIKLPSNGADLFWQPFPTVTVGDAISDLPEILNGGGVDETIYTSSPSSNLQKELRGRNEILFDHRVPKMGDLMMSRCSAIPRRPGAGWLDLPDHLKPLNLVRHGDKRYENRFGRLNWNGTFNTILSKPEPYWGAVFHPEQDRMISVRESARAQSFPDEVRFVGSVANRYRQIGNAVPPRLAKEIGFEIVKAAESARDK